MAQGEFGMAFAPKTKDYIFWRELGVSVGKRRSRHFEKFVSALDSQPASVPSPGEAIANDCSHQSLVGEKRPVL